MRELIAHQNLSNRARSNGVRAATVALTALALAGCAVPQLNLPTERPPASATAPAPTEASVTDVADQLLADGQFSAAATAYEQLATRSEDAIESQHYRLRAAEILIDNGEIERSRTTLSALPVPLEGEDLIQRKALLDASLLLADGDTEASLAALPEETSLVTPSALVRFHTVRAAAATEAGQPGNALASLINLDILEGGTQRDTRNVEIWDLLSELDTNSLQSLLDVYEEDLPRGWLELALDIDDVRAERAALGPTVSAWKSRYPGHPAGVLLVAYDDSPTSIVASRSLQSLRIGDISSVALLLPFTDRLQSFSGAIRDGAISTLLDSDTAVSLEVYDVGEAASGSLGAYQRAVANGADLVIGPLRRNAALALATSATLQVPVLSLNYLNDRNLVNNLIQFGLSPEDEARNAADFIIGNGLYNAAVIHPATDTGGRSARAFSDRLVSWGGQVLATTELPADATDFRRELSALLLTDQSFTRRRQLENVLGTKLTFEAQEREDIEAVFMPVSPALGRLLKPQLDFHGADRIPVVSTSLVYAGRPRAEADRDLNSVYFNDIPWLLSKDTGERGVRSAARELGVEEGPLARFFALGSDAMTLALNLSALSLGDVAQVQGNTGLLTLADGRVQRKLPFAQFNRGLPKPTIFSYPGEPEPAVPDFAFDGEATFGDAVDPRAIPLTPDVEIEPVD